jgi:hypothetical protein
MNKTKLVALCGVCGAIAVVCIVLLSYVKWVALALAVVGSVVACCPQMIDGKYVWYSVATYLVVAVVGVLVGNIVYVAPVALYAMPCCIWKLFCRHKQPCNALLWKTLKWVGSLVLMVLAAFVTALLVSRLMPSTWQSFVQDATLVWVAVVALVLGIIAYDKLLDGAVFVVKKALDKSKFVQ